MDERARQVLREEAREALRIVRELPRFKERLEDLPDTPEYARGWSWRTVKSFVEQRRGVGIAWVWSDLSAVSEEERRDVIAEIQAARKESEMLTFARGELEALVPVEVPKPTDAELEALSRYVAATEHFAAECLFGAQWSARALHDAVRRGAPIDLPTGRQDWVLPPVAAQITLDPEQPLPRESLRELAEAILEVTGHSGHSGLGDARRVTWDRSIEAIRRRLGGSARAGGLTPEKRQDREQQRNRERQALSQARRYLDAAVNGDFDLPPLELSDDPSWQVLDQRSGLELMKQRLKRTGDPEILKALDDPGRTDHGAD